MLDRHVSLLTIAGISLFAASVGSACAYDEPTEFPFQGEVESTTVNGAVDDDGAPAQPAEPDFQRDPFDPAPVPSDPSEFVNCAGEDEALLRVALGASSALTA